MLRFESINLFCFELKMATVLQHQVENRVNEINCKLTQHARIIFGLSCEIDKIKNENEELKKILLGHKLAIKKLIKNDGQKDADTYSDSIINDISSMSKNDLKKEYNKFAEGEGDTPDIGVSIDIKK